MFSAGDKIVYPMHGAGIICGIEEKKILGEKKEYYIFKCLSSITMVTTNLKEWIFPNMNGYAICAGEFSFVNLTGHRVFRLNIISPLFAIYFNIEILP